MTTHHAGDLLRDRDGRLLKLVDYVDPVGDVGPYWRAVTLDPTTGTEGRRSSIRADRLDQYEQVNPVNTDFAQMSYDGDVRVDAYRGAGTAVRVTHVPTGTVVTEDAAQHGGSSYAARAAAFARLNAMIVKEVDQ